MIVAAVVCPPAPLLVAGLADRLAGLATGLLDACDQAMECLRRVDRIVVVSAATGAAAGLTLGPGEAVTAAGLARSDRPVVSPVRLPGAAATSPGGADCASGRPAVAPTTDGHSAGPAAAPPVAVGTVVGAYLLTRAGVTAPTCALQVGAAATVPTAVPLAAIPAPGGAADATRVGLLAMVDGAACHGEHAPGAPDPRSEAFDADIVTALRSGDPATLAHTCDNLAQVASELRADALPALASMAALAIGNGPARAEVLHYSAPFGVGYVVAVWQWD